MTDHEIVPGYYQILMTKCSIEYQYINFDTRNCYLKTFLYYGGHLFLELYIWMLTLSNDDITEMFAST